MLVRYEIGDIVKMKKNHPCGADRWEIMRTGIDFRLKCLGCGHFVMIPRPKFEKNVKEILEHKAPEKVENKRRILYNKKSYKIEIVSKVE